MMTIVLLLHSFSFAQECPSQEVLDACCDPVPPHPECAFQAVPSEETGSGAGVGVTEWLTDGESGANWVAKSRAHWNMTYLSEPDPANGGELEPDFLRFVADPTAATGSLRGTGGGSGFQYEVSCGILTAGNIACWGSPSASVLNVPTGTNFEFGALDVGNLSNVASTYDPIWVALDNSGCVYSWGNDGPSPNMFSANKPTSCGWDTIAVGANAFGCVADSAGSGVTCWKSSTGARAVPDNAPTTGSFKHLAVSRYLAVGTKTDGSVVMWGDTTHSPNLIAAWTAAGVTKTVQEARVYGDASIPYAVLYHDDHTITIVEDPDNTSSVNLLKTAPCKDPPPSGTCAGTSWNVWTSAVKFRSAPEINRSNIARVCGVVESDPDAQYNPGAVICWGGTYSAATFDPMVVDDSCPQPAWWL